MKEKRGVRGRVLGRIILNTTTRTKREPRMRRAGFGCGEVGRYGLLATGRSRPRQLKRTSGKSQLIPRPMETIGAMSFQFRLGEG